MSEALPVHILTGFLGSGKTTLLARLLTSPALSDTAVFINELGDIGIDHLIVREVAEDVVLLSSGCLCCTVRDDMVSALSETITMADSGKIPRFRRAVIETTGLADPIPILQAIMGEPQLSRKFAVGAVITTVDAVHGLENLDRHRETVRQIAMADYLVITKTDLVDASRIGVITSQLLSINPVAERIILDPSMDAKLVSILEHYTITKQGQDHIDITSGDSKPRHNTHIGTFCIALDQPISWAPFLDWLILLLANRGQQILRVKGLLRTKERTGPLLIHGVQHMVYPPAYRQEWPAGRNRTELVFIARDLTKVAIERSFTQFMAEG